MTALAGSAGPAGAPWPRARIARDRARWYRRLARAFGPPPFGPRSGRREYTRLFVAPRPQVYPYESMHREHAPRVLGDSTLEVARWYRRAGFTPPGGWRDLPDHVALELGFMAALAGAEAAHWRRGHGDLARAAACEERRFLEAHLLPWVPDFCAAVLQVSPRGRLARAARELRAGLSRDHDWLLTLTEAAA